MCATTAPFPLVHSSKSLSSREGKEGLLGTCRFVVQVVLHVGIILSVMSVVSKIKASFMQTRDICILFLDIPNSIFETFVLFPELKLLNVTCAHAIPQESGLFAEKYSSSIFRSSDLRSSLWPSQWSSIRNARIRYSYEISPDLHTREVRGR